MQRCGPASMKSKKYVVSDAAVELSWVNSQPIQGDVVASIKELKEQEGAALKVFGSSGLAQTLLKHDLADELWLMIFPVTLGKGKRLFGEGAIPAAFELIESLVTSNGVIFANYKRAGEVQTGTVGA